MLHGVLTPKPVTRFRSEILDGLYRRDREKSFVASYSAGICNAAVCNPREYGVLVLRWPDRAMGPLVDTNRNESRKDAGSPPTKR